MLSTIFLAIAMKTGEKINKNKLKKPFSLCFTSDEEVGCLGARKLMRKGVYLGKYVVIGEPTEMMPLNLHKGYMFIRIILRGKTGHASVPGNGKSVIHSALSLVLREIEKFSLVLSKIIDNRFSPDCPTINIGVVTTDNENKKSSKNLIADFCKIELEIRPIPGQEPEEIFFVFNKIISDTISGIDGISVKVEFARAPTPPMETDFGLKISDEIVKITGNNLQSVCFNTEGGVFNRFGASSIICGPGSINQAHKAREFVDAKYFKDNIVDQYVQLIKNICY